MTRGKGMDPQFVGYFVRLAVSSVVAAAVILALATVLIVTIQPSPAVGLVIVLIAVIFVIAALAVISRRLTARFLGTGHVGTGGTPDE
ncbi:MAG: hypothetical protein L0H59_05970 [Tomitella sp.]|nr:hypothetical protein [Tomitella sp.]